MQIPVSQIEADPQFIAEIDENSHDFHACVALVQSGIPLPIIVRQVADNKYEVAHGFLEFRAAQLLQLPEIDAGVLEGATQLEAFCVGLCRERDSLKFNKRLSSLILRFGEAVTIRLLSKYGITPDQVRKCGVFSRLIDSAWNALMDGSLPMPNALVLTCATPMKQRKLLEEAKVIAPRALKARIGLVKSSNENKGLKKLGVQLSLKKRQGDELRRAIISPDYMQPFLTYTLTPNKIREAREVLRWAMSVDKMTQQKRLDNGDTG